MLVKLLEAYFFGAWFFVLLHLGVIAFAVLSLGRIRRETSALLTWRPGDRAKSEITKMLGYFIDECAELGPKGLLVPMTDFSDRIDSQLDGMIGELQDRVNLLLLVGIAGTMWGVFEFVAKSGDVSGDPVLAVGKLLSESMAKAFPVGLVGLFLMLIGQIATAGFEERLRRAVATATGKAVSHRRRFTQPQSELMLQVADRIRAAMDPLGDIRSTLTESVQPVVRELGERLDAALNLIRAQFEVLNERTNAFSASVDNLKTGVNALKKVSANLENLLADAPIVLHNAIAVHEQQRVAFEETRAGLERNLQSVEILARRVTEASNAVQQLPQLLIQVSESARSHLIAQVDEVAGYMREQATGAGRTLSESWGKNLQQVAGQAGQTLEFYFDRMREDLQKLSTSLTGAAEQLYTLANNASGLLTKPMQEAIASAGDEARRALSGLHESVLQVYPAVVDKVEALGREIGLAVNGAAGARQQIADFSGRTAELRGVVTDLCTKINENTRQLESLRSAKVGTFSGQPVRQHPPEIGTVREPGAQGGSTTGRLGSAGGVHQGRSSPPKRGFWRWLWPW